MPFICSICAEAATQICARCTKDVCSNHICEKCLRCSDCCECEVVLRDQQAVPAPVVRSVATVHAQAEIPASAAESPESEPPVDTDSGTASPEIP